MMPPPPPPRSRLRRAWDLWLALQEYERIALLLLAVFLLLWVFPK